MKRWVVRAIFAVLLLAALVVFRLSGRQGEATVTGYRPALQECFEGADWRVCVFRAQGSDPQRFLYFLHGRDLDERSWNDPTYYPALIQKYWQSAGIRPPVVVSVSFGPLWVLAEKGPNPRSGLFERFTGEVIPEIERRIGAPSSRSVLGESMGGFNGLQLALKTRGVFERVASLCPPITATSPFAPWKEKWEFFKRSGAEVKTMLGVMTIAQKFTGSEEGWKRLSPLDLLEIADPAVTPPIYLSVGLYDKYGNFEGAEKFAERAAARGLRVEWRPLYGGHCSIDIPSVARFAAE